MPNYRRNEDKWPFAPLPVYNALLDISFVETGAEPVTLDEAKTHLRIAATDFDVELTAMIKQCRNVIERCTGLSLIVKTITAVINNSQGYYKLPYGPVDGVLTSVTQQGGDVITDWTFSGGYLEDANDYLTVVYNAGYTPTNIPHGLKLAVLNEIAFRFENRGESSEFIESHAAKELSKAYTKMTWLV